MQRIDDPSNIVAPQAPLATVSPGFFRRPSTLAGDQGTILTGDWANDVQENIAQAIEAVGIALAKGDGSKLSAAILQYVANHNIQGDVGTLGHWAAAEATDVILGTATDLVLTPDGTPSASQTGRGLIEIADGLECLALADSTTAITPGTLQFCFDSQLADPGYITIPTGLGGRLTVQWGSEALVGATGTADFDVTLPLAYSTAHLWAIAGSFSSSISESQNDAFAKPQSLTQIRLGSAQPDRTVYWLSIGH